MRSNGKKWALVPLILGLLALPARAQTGESRKISTAFAVTVDALDLKIAKVGQQVSLQTVGNVIVDGRIVIPENSIIVAHITQVTTKGKDQTQSALAIVIDRAVRKDEVSIPLQAIIAAVAAPRNNSLTSDPAYAMLHSNEPHMSGNPTSAASSGELSASSKATSNSAVATAELKGRMDDGWQLTEESNSAIGYEGLSITWSLATPPPFTVFVSKSKNLKLLAGTQVLLRMVPPRLPNE